MRIVDEIRYDSAPAVVAAILADREFVLAKCARMGSLSHTASIEGDPAGGFSVISTRTLPTDRVPDTARSLIGPTMQIRQVDHWGPPAADGARLGEVQVDVVGAPVHFRGRFELRRNGSGTVQRLVGEVSAGIPFLGRKIEQLTEPVIRGALHKENRVAREWLAEVSR